jgi:hypothetical protein
MGSKRRRLSTETRQTNLRLHLFSFYRANPRYRKIIEDELRPLWRAIEDEVQAKLPAATLLSPPLVTRFDQLVAAIEGRSHPPPERSNRAAPWAGSVIVGREGLTASMLEQVADYVGAVHRHLMSPFSLTLKDQPAAWAAAFVHHDVTHEDALIRFAKDVGPKVEAFAPTFILQTVTPTVASVRMVVDGVPVIDLETGGDTYNFQLDRVGPGIGTGEWEVLETNAHRILSNGLGALRQWYEGNSERHNPTKLQAETLRIEQLYRYLFPQYEGKRPKYSAAIQERLRQLAREIEIDFPQPHSPR